MGSRRMTCDAPDLTIQAAASSNRLKILISAYACEPGKGSEPGVGWNMARAIAAHHDVWVITRANNRDAVQEELDRCPTPGLSFAYFDLPRWLRWWKKGGRGVRLYYYLWQIGAYLAARRLNRTVRYDVVHHLTFVKYWAPSFLWLLPVPFVWGPVGGGESAPRAFWPTFGLRGWLYEAVREAARWVAEKDPFVRMTARRSALALATTAETAHRLRSLGVRDTRLMLAVGISDAELGSDLRQPSAGIRFVSVGRLLHWKGFHLALRAFAELRETNTEYWVIGNGPEGAKLRRLAGDLGVSSRVRFWGALPRDAALARIAECDVLVHPSLHESGGWVCLEAMAAAKPLICLDLGGPGALATDEAGFKVAATDPEHVVEAMARAMRDLAVDPKLRRRLGHGARVAVEQSHLWRLRAERMSSLYREVVAIPRPASSAGEAARRIAPNTVPSSSAVQSGRSVSQFTP